MKYTKAGEVSKAVKVLSSPLSSPPHTSTTLLKLPSKYPGKFTGDSELPYDEWAEVESYSTLGDSSDLPLLPQLVASRKLYFPRVD